MSGNGAPIEAPGKDAILDPNLTPDEVNERIASRAERPRTGVLFMLAFGISGTMFAILLVAVTVLFWEGVGVWGINIPVGWGFAIINFVWWIGIGHAGTFISAFLILMHEHWRTPINRYAESMTLFAVMAAAMFPILHLGRPWLFYYLLPYPDTMRLWPQWRSALVWDVFAISTYGIVSILFWYVGLVPDLAVMRDRATRAVPRYVYGILSLGWRNSVRHWARQESAYLLLGGIATPLVVSVHSLVSLDFAISMLPGWQSAIFPPYFVAGAIFSGFAMALNLGIPLRKLFHLEAFITPKVLDNMALMMLGTGLFVAYGYAMENFAAWYSDDRFEWGSVVTRTMGPYRYVYWSVIALNVGVNQLLWWPRMRSNTTSLFLIALAINIGMWLERFMIVITSLHRDFLPANWGMYYPTHWDWLTLLGSLGLFLFAFYIFTRWIPVVSMAEERHLLHEGKVKRHRALPEEA